jgi:hypothetical protein
MDILYLSLSDQQIEMQNLELGIEDILSLHRQWITKLYIEDKKTEAEIVVTLYERRVSATYESIILLITMS